MKEIFDKACEEIADLGADEKTKENFRTLTQKKWLEDFHSDEFPSYEENKHLGAARLIEKFVGRNKLGQCSDKWLWQSCIGKTAQESCPYTSFTVLLLADALYQKLEGIEEFYKVEADAKRPYQQFMNGLLQDMPKHYDYYEVLKPHLDKVLETGISEPLKKIIGDLKAAIPEPEPEPAPAPAVAGAESAGSQPAAQPGQPGVPLRPEYEKEPFFKSFLLTEALETICTVVYNDIHKGKTLTEEQLVKLQQSLGMPSYRHRFITNLNVLYWYLHKGNEKAVYILRSLWDMVFQLAARDKKDINLDAPQDIILALWEPGLYIGLVKLTIEAFVKFGENKCSFTIGGKKFDNSAIDKLKSHEFMIGVHI